MLSKAWDSSLTLLQPIKNLHVGPQGLKEHSRSPWNHLLSFSDSEKPLPASPSCFYLYHMPSRRNNFSPLPTFPCCLQRTHILSAAPSLKWVLVLDPACLSQRSGAFGGKVSKIMGEGRRETNWTLKNIYLIKWLGKTNSMESSTNAPDFTFNHSCSR